MSSKSGEEEGMQMLLDSITSQTCPSGLHAAYHAKHLELLVRRMESQPARSTERSTETKACLDSAWRMMRCRPGGCCTPAPYLTALLLAEDQTLAHLEGRCTDAAGKALVGRRLCHQFPWLPQSAAAMALIVHHHLIAKGPPPGKAKDRTLIIQVLSPAMDASADSLPGWQLLSELQLQNEQPEAAAESAGRGLKCLAQRRSRGYLPPPEVAAGIVLARGHSLLALDRLDEAQAMFKALTDLSSSSPVSQLLDSVPKSVQQEALRGQALILKQQGDTAAAEQLLADLAQREQGPECMSQHLAQTDYGTLLLEQGNLQGAQVWLEKAVASASLPGSHSTDKQLARARLQLGSAYWQLGRPPSQEVRGQAYGHWLAAASVGGSHQAAAFAKLGLWYADFKADVPRARKCFQRALGLNPLQSEAGEGLCNLLRAEGRADTAQALCQEVSSRAPGATWAWRRLAFFCLHTGDFEKAVLCFQTALRGDVGHAGAWEGLGSAYQSLARLTAALKAYGRAIELEPKRLFSLVQSGLVLLALGNYTEAQGLVQAALEADPQHVSALFAAAQLLLASAKYRIAQGTPGMAAKDLALAARYCQRCSQGRGHLQVVWKLMGDVHLQFHAATPPAQDQEHGTEAQGCTHGIAAGGNGRGKAGALQKALHSWELRISAMKASRRAYARALHLAPAQGSLWGDVSATFYHEAQLRRAHPKLDPHQAHHLRASAEALIRGGLRLEPSSAALWAGLGTCARGAPHQEYAFTRSLHLDPKCARTWAALGRLYMESGARGLADTCFTQARSQEPADSATWAAMGALAGLSPTGGSEKADFYQHAVKLGAGPEALAGFAEGALGEGRASSGGVYAAARRVVEAQPYSAAAHNMLGLACQARGHFAGALQAYSAGLDVCTDHYEGWGTRDRIAGPLCLVQQEADPAFGLQHALELNSACALSLNSQHEEAVKKFKLLEESGRMHGAPSAWLSYASALYQLHKGDAKLQAQNALERGISDSPAPQEHAALLHAWIKLELADLQPTPPYPIPTHAPSNHQPDLQQLSSHAEALTAGKPEAAMLRPLWLTVSAAAAASSEAATAAGLRELVRSWRAQADDDSAEFEAELLGLDALFASQTGQKLQAARHAARALHICPWRPLQTALAARTALDASLTSSSSARRLAATFPQSHLCRATQSYQVLPADLPNEAVLMDMLTVMVTGAVAQPCLLDAARELRVMYKDALQRAHSQPHCASIWYLLASLALHYAASTQQAAAYRSALALCNRALHMLDCSSAPEQLDCKEQANGHLPQQQQQQQRQQQQQQQQQRHHQQQVQLQCMRSECHLHTRQGGSHEQAMSCAKAAVRAASGFCDPELTAAALQQLSRCLEHAQQRTKAEEACKKALVGRPGRPTAVLQLARLLHGSNKHQEALDTLDQGLQHLSVCPSVTAHQCVEPQLNLRWRLVLCLHKAQVLATMGDLHQATSVCQEAAGLSLTSGHDLQPHADTAQVVLGALSLQSAESEPDTPNAMASLSTAHKMFTQALAGKGKLGRQDSALVCWLLARTELLGTLRRKQEKAEAHAMQVRLRS
ncbi:hypothetical protein ABBQ38_006975 [Trebouxia sp. C0009 RCD-2024]